MPESIVYRLIGPPKAVTAVVNTSSGLAPITITSLNNEQANYTAFSVVGGGPVAITLSNSAGQPPPPAIFPTTTINSVAGTIVVTPNQPPLVVGTPSNYQMAVVSNSTVSSQLYIQQVGDV